LGSWPQTEGKQVRNNYAEYIPKIPSLILCTVSVAWQNGIGAATNCGEIIGLHFAGFLSERFGYRWTLIVALVGLIGFIFIPFFANTLTVFLVGEMFCGVSWGVFQTMTTAYAVEVRS
jgi:MFS transporter, SP family, general alpha glucoside:H+ symporter